MFDFNKKKISLSILLISLALISFISKAKIKVELPIAFDNTLNQEPTDWEEIYVFKLFNNVYSYNNTLFILSLFIIISILLFVFTDDLQIRKKMESLKKLIFQKNVILIAVTIVVVLIIVRSCENYLDKTTTLSNEKTKVITDSLDYTTQLNDTLAAPAAPAIPPKIYDSINIVNHNYPKNSNGKHKLSRFQEIKKEQAESDPAISHYTGQN